MPKSKLCYIDNPKVASTSIKEMLLKSEGLDREKLNKDLHTYFIETYTQDVSQKDFPYFSFIFVRNPFERVVSTYKNMYSRPKGSWSTFQNYLFGWFEKDKGFEFFVKKGPVKISDKWADEHLLSQYLMMYYNGEPCHIDFIGRFETLKEDWGIIQEKTGLCDLPLSNQSSKEDWRNYYTLELMDIVYERYQKDFELLGYMDEYQKLKNYLTGKE